ncbi:MAG: hypothetical protein H6710_03425 [Myxococcales bacterium]|nr:hypothetical protein [Myxococcales bacterium]
MRPRRGLRSAGPPALAGLLAAACSSLAPEPKSVECQSDDECDVVAGEVCAIDQGNVCLKATLPPRPLLGLDVREAASSFRVDVRGTDAAVERVTTRTPSRYRVSVANRGSDPLFPGVRDTLSLTLREIDYFASQDAGETQWEPLNTQLTISQPSRIGQSAHSLSFTYPLVDPMTMEALPEAPLVTPWPHYSAGDYDGDRPVTIELKPPTDGEATFGIIHRILRRDQIPEAAEHNITVDVTRECNRRVTGDIFVLSKAGEPTDDLDGISSSVTLRYGGGVTSPATIQPPPAKISCSSDQNCPAPNTCIKPDAGAKYCGCESDSECPVGQACYLPQKRCALDLRDVIGFRRGDIKTIAGTATVDGLLYTHCEGAVEEAQELPLVAVVEPSAESGLPRLSYSLLPSFAAAAPGEEPAETPLGGKLCLPHWRPTQTVSVPLSGAPANLHTTGVGSFICCGTECLSSATPGTKPTTCTPSATVSTAGTYNLPEPPGPGEPSEWEQAGCLPLYVPGVDEPTSIRFTRAGVACTAEGCDLPLSSGAYSSDLPFVYELRIEPGVGSIFRSVLLNAEVAPDTLELPPSTLPHRVLVRGSVVLEEGICKVDPEDESSDCTASAVVLAERIRLPEEEGTTVLGPYFYSQATFGEGDFVVPVNPGVYLVTALPLVGSQGGPAKIQILDLREDSPLVDVRSGIPYADLDDPLVLEQGQLVTVELDGFSSNTTVIPLDMASWADLSFEGMAIDLGAQATCYRTAGDPPACQIRRLRPGSTTLRPSQEQFVKFITRD